MQPKPRIGRSIVTAIRDVSDAFGAMPVPFLLMFGAALADGAVTSVYVPDPQRVQLGTTLLAYATVSALFMGLFAAPLAVLIHRRIILGEEGGVGRLAAISGRVFDFYVASVLLQVALSLPTFAMGAAAQSRASGWLVTLAVVGVAAAMYIALKLFLLFPAIAVDAADKSLSSAYRRSRGLVWRFFWIAMLLGVGFALATSAVTFSVAKFMPGAAGPFKIAATALKDVIFAASAVAIASRFYIWREEDGQPSWLTRADGDGSALPSG